MRSIRRYVPLSNKRVGQALLSILRLNKTRLLNSMVPIRPEVIVKLRWRLACLKVKLFSLLTLRELAVLHRIVLNMSILQVDFFPRRQSSRGVLLALQCVH